MKRTAVLVGALLATCAMASGATITQTEAFAGVPDFSIPLTFNSFDTSLGTLNSVELLLDLVITGGQAQVDNESPSSANVSVEFGADAGIMSGGEVFIPSLTAVASVTQNLLLDPDDGDGVSIDPSPTDGATVPIVSTTGADSALMLRSNGGIEAMQVATFEDASAGVDFVLMLDSGTVFSISGASGVAGGFTPASVAGDVTVVYNYTPVPEPVSMSLLALGGVALLRRRK
jgi:hypothetical protein